MIESESQREIEERRKRNVGWGKTNLIPCRIAGVKRAYFCFMDVLPCNFPLSLFWLLLSD